MRKNIQTSFASVIGLIVSSSYPLSCHLDAILLLGQKLTVRGDFQLNQIHLRHKQRECLGMHNAIQVHVEFLDHIVSCMLASQNIAIYIAVFIKNILICPSSRAEGWMRMNLISTKFRNILCAHKYKCKTDFVSIYTYLWENIFVCQIFIPVR